VKKSEFMVATFTNNTTQQFMIVARRASDTQWGSLRTAEKRSGFQMKLNGHHMTKVAAESMKELLSTAMKNFGYTPVTQLG